MSGFLFMLILFLSMIRDFQGLN